MKIPAIGSSRKIEKKPTTQKQLVWHGTEHWNFCTGNSKNSTALTPKCNRSLWPNRKNPTLDGFPFPPIIGRNQKHMNPSFSLSLIVVVLIVVLIIKDLFVVRMAAQ